MKPRGGEGQNGRLKCPMGFLVSTKDGLHRRMPFVDSKSGALEIFGPKTCYFSTIEKFSVTWVLIDRS